MDMPRPITEFDYGSYRYNKEISPSMRSPLFIGDFSLDCDRKFHADRRNLKFIATEHLKEDKVNFDLNRSMDKVKRKNMFETKKENLDNLLDWILLNKYKFYTEESKQKGFKSLSTDIVCFRGLLTELLCTPYEDREGWIIHATKFAGTLYLLGVETPEKIQQRESETEFNRRMCSWGFKFEQYMTNEDPAEGVDENEEYCCLLRSRLSSHSLVYGAEVDGVDKERYSHPHSSLKAFIELKTCKQLITQRDMNSFYRFRLRKWFVQSHLVGVPRLICGFRSPDGVVEALKSFSVEEMPGMAKVHWSKDVMFNFLNDFLSWVKLISTQDDPTFVYEFVSFPRQKRITAKPLGKNSDKKILPKKYVDELFS